MKKHFNKTDIAEFDKKFQIHFVNSLSGHKSANLIGTKDKFENLGIFSSVFHLGSSPGLLGFIMRPNTVRRDTYNNIKATGEYTINHIAKSFYENAHYASAKFEESESEFEKLNLIPEYKGTINAPYVLESKVQIGLKLVEEYEIDSNGCILMVGEIQEVFIDEQSLDESGKFNWNLLETVSITGLNQYHSTSQIDDLPYARLENLPDFHRKNKKRSDQVVYDEETETYTTSLKKYGTDLSAPAIEQTDMTNWKNIGSNKVNHHLKTRFEKMKQEYESMLELYQWNEAIYNSKFDFEPIVGEKYHLYERDNGERFLSSIPPEEWNKTHIGSFELDLERVFVKVLNNKLLD